MNKNKTERPDRVALALAVVADAQTMSDLLASVADLIPDERNSKLVGFQVTQATERIVGMKVKPY